LRYHKLPEYKRLSDPEKEEEPWEWHEAQGHKSKGGGPNQQPKKQNQQAIAAAVEKKFDKRIEAKLKAMEASKTKEGEAEAFVISCLERYAKLPPKLPSSAILAPVKASQVQFLQSILGRSKNTPPWLSSAAVLTSPRRETMVTPKLDNRKWIYKGVDAAYESNNDDDEIKLFKINVPTQIFAYMATIADAEVDDGNGMRDDNDDDESCRTELDSHANMPVVGRHAYIILDQGWLADVSPFTPDYAPMQLRIVDAAVQYDCPYSGKSYILVLRNTLYVPSMKHNLLPPFVLREAGIKLNDTPKFQLDDPTIEEHSMLFPETGFRIPLSLWGTFPYFPTRKPTATQMQESEEIYMLTPTRFNPHDDAYASNEANMLDWEGTMIENEHRTKIVLLEVGESEAMAASVQVSSIQSRAIDLVLDSCYDDEETVERIYKTVPRAADQISSVLGAVSPLLDDVALYNRMSARLDLGNYQATIGSTNATGKDYLIDDDRTIGTEPSTDVSDDEYSDEVSRNRSPDGSS
jgi:hypothetical protein